MIVNAGIIVAKTTLIEKYFYFRELSEGAVPDREVCHRCQCRVTVPNEFGRPPGDLP